MGLASPARGVNQPGQEPEMLVQELHGDQFGQRPCILPEFSRNRRENR